MRLADGGVLFAKGYACSVAYSDSAEKVYPDFALLCSEKSASAAVVLPKGGSNLSAVVAREYAADGMVDSVLYMGCGCNSFDVFGKQKAEYYCEWAERTGGIIAENTLPVTFGEKAVGSEPETLCPIFEELFPNDADEREFDRLFNSDFDSLKRVALEFELGGKECRLGAVAGDFHLPHHPMAILVTTDVRIAPAILGKIANDVYATTLANIAREDSVSDSVIVLANGMAENAVIDAEGIDYTLFSMVLGYAFGALKKPIARSDGEKYIEVKVNGCAVTEEARKIAMAIIGSGNVKRLLSAGADPLQAALNVLSKHQIDISNVSVALRSKGGFVELMKRGRMIDGNSSLIKLALTFEDIELFVAVGDGDGYAEVCGNEKG